VCQQPVAFITGATGQDGSYLTELLRAKGYAVHGLLPSGSAFPDRHADVCYHAGDLSDGANLAAILETVRPTEIYNLGAQSHVRMSFETPVYTGNVTGLGTVRLLQAVHEFEQRTGLKTKFYQASSSEMFGKAVETPQTERTPFHPRSPYACAKVYAFWQTVNYREAYGLFACNGILFNHESPRRGEAFVTRKITRSATRIKLGLQKTLVLGNLDAARDWGFAGDYVEAMWLMLQQPQPDDYVVATGEMHTVREFLAEVFGYLDLDWQRYVVIDPKLFRPTEVDALRGDASKARRVLGWEPKVTFRTLARQMTDADLHLARRDRLLAEADGVDIEPAL